MTPSLYPALGCGMSRTSDHTEYVFRVNLNNGLDVRRFCEVPVKAKEVRSISRAKPARKGELSRKLARACQGLGKARRSFRLSTSTQPHPSRRRRIRGRRGSKLR